MKTTLSNLIIVKYNLTTNLVKIKKNKVNIIIILLNIHQDLKNKTTFNNTLKMILIS